MIKNVGIYKLFVINNLRKEEREMKSFFEEYGFVVIAAVVVLLLVGLAPTIKGEVSTKITSLVTTLSTQAESYIPKA